MITKLDIINAALVSLGSAPVQDLVESQAATAAGAFWKLTLIATLRAHPWNFAIKRRILAPLADAPVADYSRAFPLPADWLRTLSTDADDYKQESGQILCDQTSLALRYVAYIEDPAKFDALFADTLSSHLKAKLAYPITQSTSLQDVCMREYAEKLKLARGVDAQEDIPDEFPESSLLTARR